MTKMCPFSPLLSLKNCLQELLREKGREKARKKPESTMIVQEKYRQRTIGFRNGWTSLVRCDECGTEFEKPRMESRRAVHHFCDSKCKAAFQQDNIRDYAQ